MYVALKASIKIKLGLSELMRSMFPVGENFNFVHILFVGFGIFENVLNGP